MAEKLETIDGMLVHAEIGLVNLDVAPLDGHVILTIEGHALALKFDQRQTRMLAHALRCALAPYGISEDRYIVDDPTDFM